MTPAYNEINARNFFIVLILIAVIFTTAINWNLIKKEFARAYGTSMYNRVAN